MELDRHRMDNGRRNIDKGHRHLDNGHRHGGHGDILCTGEWQELWNGCHVRLKLDKVYIYDRRGDRVLWGDEVVLLRNGTYKVYNGTFWYVHDADGDRIFNLWGDSVELMGGDRYRIYRSGNYHYFDWNGNELR